MREQTFMSHTHLLIVHTDGSVRALLASMLRSLGHRIEEAACDPVAVKMVATSEPALVVAGTDPADPDALEFLGYLRRKHAAVRVILLFPTAHPERTREALQRGAASVLRFPLPATHLRAAVSQALEESGASPFKPADGYHSASNGTNGHHAPPAATGTSPNGYSSAAVRVNEPVALIGDDPSMRQGIELAATIGPTRAPVLIVGERGTGKTLLARTLHQKSPRRDAPFIEVSCSTLKESALEVELFGRKGGSAPGDPSGDRPGRLAQANGGTVFLDEISALSPTLQFKLVRLLQDGEYEQVGSNQPFRVDVRVVVATREDLAGLVEEGTFRQDLYYRISVVTLKLPPLRHRGADLDRLADHFRNRFARELGKEVVGFSPEALAALRSYDWPGNVLELENVVERSVVLCRGPRIEPAHVALPGRSGHTGRHNAPPPRPHVPMGILPLKEALEGPEKQLILQALEALNWNRQETARVLDINRTTLYKKMKKYGLLIDEPVWAS
jgi:DNA-binding NtrC family response regulator